MKNLLFFIMLLLSSLSHAEPSFQLDGLWMNSHGKYYSIHQSENTVVVAELSSQTIKLGPFEQGGIQMTNQLLDIAINGSGFFVLEKSNGSRLYTRNGNFYITPEGWLVNKDGYRLLTANQLAIPSINMQNSQIRKFVMLDEISSCILTIFDNGNQCTTTTDSRDEIKITQDGIIKIMDKDSGNYIEHDQIILASIFQKDLRFSGDYYISSNPDAVVYESSDIPASFHSHALEVRSYTSQSWQAYSGEIINGNVILQATDSSQHSNWFEKEIQFSSDTSAIINKTCLLQPTYYCETESKNEETLTKIF